jgi:hypothetical protein
LIIGLFGVLPNLLTWPFVVAAWVFAFYRRSVATVIALSVIAGLVAIDLKSESSHGYAAWLQTP